MRVKLTCFEFLPSGHCYQVVIFAFLFFALSHNEADTSWAERVCIGLQSTADTFQFYRLGPSVRAAHYLSS